MESTTFKPIIAAERVQVINGLEGRYMGATMRHDEKPGCFCDQRWVTSKAIQYDGHKCTIHVEMRFDDGCRNGHSSFAITGHIIDPTIPGRDKWVCGGCIHEEIAEHFPELAPLIKWHLCSTDGPMHHVANTVYLAGDRDHWGLLKGEPNMSPKHQRRFITFGSNPIRHTFKGGFMEWLEGLESYDLEVLGIEHVNRPGDTYNFKPKFTFGGFGSTWYDCPFDTEAEALQVLEALQRCNPTFGSEPTMFGEGKARQLDAARRSAIWPEATDAELCLPKDELTMLLNARLPALLAEFRADMERCGFLWENTGTAKGATNL